jgi:hypothetical protein
MNNSWWVLLVPVIALGAFGWASASRNTKTHVAYRCDLSRHVIAFERGGGLGLMIGGRHYELSWHRPNLARGQGLEWHVTGYGATLKRASSGYALASGCVQR